MKLFTATVTFSDGMVEHWVTDTAGLGAKTGNFAGRGRQVASIEVLATPVYELFVEGPMGQTPIWVVKFAMDKDPIQTAIFGTNDAVAIIKALEDYHGEPSRVTWLSITPAKWCLLRPTKADLPPEGSSVPTPAVRAICAAGEAEDNSKTPVLGRPSVCVRLTRLEVVARYLGFRLGYDAEHEVTRLIGANSPTSPVEHLTMKGEDCD